MNAREERELLLRAVGMALVELHNIDPATAGRFLARLVEDDLLSAEQGLVLMDALQERTQGET